MSYGQTFKFAALVSITQPPPPPLLKICVARGIGMMGNEWVEEVCNSHKKLGGRGPQNKQYRKLGIKMVHAHPPPPYPYVSSFSSSYTTLIFNQQIVHKSTIYD